MAEPKVPTLSAASGAPADLRTVRALFDEALVALPRVRDPAFPSRRMTEAVTDALRACYLALSAAADDPAAYPGAVSALKAGGRTALEVLEACGSADPAAAQAKVCVRTAMAALVEGAAARSFPRLDLPRRDGRGEQRASRLEPRELRLARDLVPPAVPVATAAPELIRPGPPPPVPEPPEDLPTPVGAERPASPEDLDELLATAEALAAESSEEPTAPAAATAPPPAGEGDPERAIFGEALSREEVLFARARSFFEDLAMMGVMRQPDAGDLWSELAPVESRLLARVDAILACGEAVLPRLVALLDDRPVPDPDLLWGLVFFFGSIGGDDAADEALRLVRTAPLADPAVFDAVADALALAPSAGLAERVRAFLGVSEPTLARLALRVLGRRRALSAQEALTAWRSKEVALMREAALALPSASGPVERQGLSRLLDHEDEAVVRAGFEASILHGCPEGMARASRLTASGQGQFAEAALYVGIAAGTSGGDALASGTVQGASQPLVEGVGWYGSSELVPWLLQRLGCGEKAAVAALQRITGASLTEDDPDPEYPPEAHPFLGRAKPPPTSLVLTAEAAAWRAWWKKHGSAARPGTRWRYGHPWSAEDDLWEMESAPVSPRERRLAYLELVARTGEKLPFDPSAFVAHQRREIEAWRAALEVGAARRGQGGFPTRLER